MAKAKTARLLIFARMQKYSTDKKTAYKILPINAQAHFLARISVFMENK